MYSKTTHNIKVTIQTAFLEEESAPSRGHYMWAYHVDIVNQNDCPVRLLAREWHIINARGQMETVYGAGVVGQQPFLKAGQSFAYSSGTPLATPSGLMYGTYTFTNNKGEVWEVDIPSFSLDSPYCNGLVH